MKAKKKAGLVTDYFGVIEPYDEHFALTKNSALIGAIELCGRDADGLLPLDHAALSGIAQSIYGKLNRSITVSEYYAHFDGMEITLRDRKNSISHTLSQRRAEYLNKMNLSGSRIVHYFEIDPDENLNKLRFADMLRHLGLAAFDGRSRTLLKNALSANDAFVVELGMLDRMQAQLNDAMQEVTAKWAGLFSARILPLQETWAHMRFLAGLDPIALDRALHEALPEEDWDIYLSSGDITNVVVGGMDVLKVSGVTNKYVKMGAVRRFSGEGGKMKPGLWAADDKSPARLKGNYVLMTRWKPLTEFQKAMLFTKKNMALERASLNFFSMMTGGENRNVIEKQASMKPAIKAKMEELGVAESMPDNWGIGHSFVCIFGEDPKKVRQTALDMNRAAGNANVNITWESVGVDRAFKTFQPGQGRESRRDLYMTSSQFAAASLIYQSSSGQMIIPDLGNEEATYPLQSKDGKVFHFSPFVGGRGMLVGIGPIRSGKTFFKNTYATHFQKYDGLYRAVDIDPGSETVAQLFGSDSGVFRVSNEPGCGSNPFASYRGPGDTLFKVHLTRLLHQCLQANDTPEHRTIAPDEQQAMDNAINATLELPEQQRTLSTLVLHMPKKLRVKFARWVRKADESSAGDAGWYAHLFDADKDSVGALNKKIGVFNLQALRDDPKAIIPVQTDILYRITQAFEDPALRHVPKLLDLDECHYPLSIPSFAEYIVQKIRTWGKWFGSVHMWTQSPEELDKLAGWPAIRSACTTFVFMADPNMDEALYMRTFPFLTAGECAAIRELIPKREAYIIQHELGVSKTVVIDVEPEQRVVNTSHPREAALRDALIKQYGFEDGLRRAVEQLAENMVEEGDDSKVVSRLKVVNSD
ncbi:hypothetical protein EGT07_23725 [Herbaspirillum sp. HC18]|nr:hypothetical protein EGT07_23725 [Herbaspirillum sp. HC18]